MMIYVVYEGDDTGWKKATVVPKMYLAYQTANRIASNQGKVVVFLRHEDLLQGKSCKDHASGTRIVIEQIQQITVELTNGERLG